MAAAGGNKVKVKNGVAVFKDVRLSAELSGSYAVRVQSASRKVSGDTHTAAGACSRNQWAAGVCAEWASGLLSLTRIWTALSPQVALQEAVLHVTMMQQSIVTSLHLVPSEDLAAGCRAGSTSKPCPSFFSELAWPCHAPRPQSH